MRYHQKQTLSPRHLPNNQKMLNQNATNSSSALDENQLNPRQMLKDKASSGKALSNSGFISGSGRTLQVPARGNASRVKYDVDAQLEDDISLHSKNSRKSKYSHISKQSALDHESLLEQIGLKEDKSSANQGDVHEKLNGVQVNKNVGKPLRHRH